MSELFELSRKYAEQRLELNRTKEAIREFAKQEGYEESAYIGDPIHFEVAGMRFTPIRVTGCAASQSLPPESEGEPLPDSPTDETIAKAVEGVETEAREEYKNFANKVNRMSDTGFGL